MSRFMLQLGDITAMNVEAIVNSTDPSLLAGGPVHAAIHEAAGPGLAQECAALGGCPAGEVRITGAHQLPMRCVIHTVAPTWVDGHRGELKILENCYLNALRLAEARGLRSLAFPSLGSGLQPQIPLERAAPLVVRTIQDFLNNHKLPEKVTLVCIDPTTYRAYQDALRESLP